jgi:acetylornithine deacetylase/succinyl-diaminopimelate desuccinylase-like protein
MLIQVMQQHGPLMDSHIVAPFMRAKSGARLLSNSLARPIPTKFWNFATDGSHFSEAGMTVIGFAPGNEALAHPVNEHIELAQWHVSGQ